MLKFKPLYFVLAIILFVIEVLIAVYAHDEIIRPYLGDVLVVMLIYCFVKSFFSTAFLSTALAVLLFSYFIEALQYLHVVNRLGLAHSKLALLIIGTSFSWMDIMAYTIGVAIVIFIEMVTVSARKTPAETK